MIGPGSGKAADAPNIWSDKLTAADSPGTSPLEVDLGDQGAQRM